MFSVQRTDVPQGTPFVAERFTDGSAYFFPMPAITEQTDPAARRIAALPGPGTVVRVSMVSWHGARGIWLARALAEKVAEGAHVEVVYGDSSGSSVRSILRTAGVTAHRGVFPDGQRIHTKLMLASYTVGGVRHHAIWTGSDNWTDRSPRNDDDVVRIQDDLPAYRAYQAFFARIADR